jgi:DNA-binding CsgD family transcriptional regulator
MSFWLSADDIRRYERATRAMLAPLEAESADEWRRTVNEAVRDLVGGDESISMLPRGSSLFLSEESPDLAQGVENFIIEYSPSGILVSDPVVALWQRMRRKSTMESFSWASNAKMIGEVGYRMQDSPMISDVLAARGIRDFVGLHPDVAFGDVLVWILFKRRDESRFGEHTQNLLLTLLPQLKAGLDSLIRFDAQRTSLDELSDAVMVYGADRREVHRNASFVRLCGSDPEHEIIVGAARSIANSLHPLVFPGRRAWHAPGIRKISTRSATYELKGTLLPPGAFGGDASVMILVSRVGVTLPDADTVRDRFGLSRREAEVALLLAEGLSNAEIADRLFLSPHTARRHTANIYEKLGVNTRKGLALLFLN